MARKKKDNAVQVENENLVVDQNVTPTTDADPNVKRNAVKSTEESVDNGIVQQNAGTPTTELNKNNDVPASPTPVQNPKTISRSKLKKVGSEVKMDAVTAKSTETMQSAKQAAADADNIEAEVGGLKVKVGSQTEKNLVEMVDKARKGAADKKAEADAEAQLNEIRNGAYYNRWKNAYESNGSFYTDEQIQRAIDKAGDYDFDNDQDRNAFITYLTDLKTRHDAGDYSDYNSQSVGPVKNVAEQKGFLVGEVNKDAIANAVKKSAPLQFDENGKIIRNNLESQTEHIKYNDGDILEQNGKYARIREIDGKYYIYPEEGFDTDGEFKVVGNRPSYKFKKDEYIRQDGHLFKVSEVDENGNIKKYKSIDGDYIFNPVREYDALGKNKNGKPLNVAKKETSKEVENRVKSNPPRSGKRTGGSYSADSVPSNPNLTPREQFMAENGYQPTGTIEQSGDATTSTPTESTTQTVASTSGGDEQDGDIARFEIDEKTGKFKKDKYGNLIPKRIVYKEKDYTKSDKEEDDAVNEEEKEAAKKAIDNYNKQSEVIASKTASMHDKLNAIQKQMDADEEIKELTDPDRKKKAKARRIVGMLADAFSAVANFIGTTKGALDVKQTSTTELIDKKEKARKEELKTQMEYWQKKLDAARKSDEKSSSLYEKTELAKATKELDYAFKVAQEQAKGKRASIKQGRSERSKRDADTRKQYADWNKVVDAYQKGTASASQREFLKNMGIKAQFALEEKKNSNRVKLEGIKTKNRIKVKKTKGAGTSSSSSSDNSSEY